MVDARFGSFAVGMVLAMAVTPLAAQFAVRFVRVPDVVVLPAPPGTNLIAEVEVDAVVPAVLLFAEGSNAHVPLAPAGERRWQINLADPAVRALLPEGVESGSFVVRGLVHAPNTPSARIHWSRTTAVAEQQTCRVQLRDGTTIRARASGRAFVPADGVAAIDLSSDGLVAAKAHLRCAGEHVEFQRSADGTRLSCSIDDAWRARLAAADSFSVEITGWEGPDSFEFAAIPSRVEPASLGQAFRLAQRTATAVPGTRDYVRVAIDDITAGGTELEVRGADGRVLRERQLVMAGESVAFRLGETDYVVVVDRLINYLLDEDLAELRVMTAANHVVSPIAELVRRVAASQDVFVRGGLDYSGMEAAQFLRIRSSSASSAGVTVDRFVDEIASKSTRDGSDYHVRREKDGSVVTMREWLRAELRAFEAEQKSKR